MVKPSVTNQRFRLFIHRVNEIVNQSKQKETRGFPALFKISHLLAEKPLKFTRPKLESQKWE